MSREFWARSFPQKRGSSTISEFNKIADWNNPPDKNTDSAESTDDIANETAKYFAHLGAKRERTAETEAAAKRMLDLLGNRTVNLFFVDLDRSGELVFGEVVFLYSLLLKSPQANSADCC